ncbi:MAG: flagellar hook-associated protein FlgK [Phycisphaerae bacterium]|nr:flagellar hook-associated protein FlgK [Phycisphaerae bacterium]
MGVYDIGISGINAAQTALDVIGNNIANAATEGFHRQEVDLRPRNEVYNGGLLIGNGVEVARIRRMVDHLLEEEIVRQQSTMSQISRELEALQTMESTFAELTASALSSALDSFFNALHTLSSQPSDTSLQSMAMAGGESLTFQLRNMSVNLTALDDRVYAEADETVRKVNLLAHQIATMNQEIQSLTIRGGSPNNLLDQRAGLITRLGELVGIKVTNKEYNSVDVTVGDTSLVLGSHVTELKIGLVENAGNYDLGLAAVGAEKYSTTVSGGTLGGLFNLRNNIIRDVDDRLDTLALSIIQQVNQLHVQGVGTAGSFTNLTGWVLQSETLSQFKPPVTDGTMYIRITDAAGNVTRAGFDVDADTHTMSDITAWLGGLTGINSSGTTVSGGKFRIQAEAGYTFDFLGGALADIPPSGANNTMAGFGGIAAPLVKISGTYTGAANEMYTATVKTTPAGQTGLAIGNGSMTLEVTNAAGQVVAVLNVGQDYEPGAVLTLEEGIRISLNVNGASPGYLNDGEFFRIEALANTDASGVLAATGMNTFFKGAGAASIDICDDVRNSGARIATRGAVAQTDNSIALAIARLGDQAFSTLGNLTPKAYYRTLATDIGDKIAINQIKLGDAEGVWRNLREQRDAVSGVDLNQEATRMLMYERMFQSMAKFLNAVSRTQDALMTMI